MRDPVKGTPGNSRARARTRNVTISFRGHDRPDQRMAAEQNVSFAEAVRRLVDAVADSELQNEGASA